MCTYPHIFQMLVCGSGKPVSSSSDVCISRAEGVCWVLGATYANGWLIMVGASRTSPVPGSGMRRRHERRRTLPRFGALLGDNTPSPALQGLRMITKALVSTMVLLELYARGRRWQGLLSSPLGVSLILTGWNPLHGCPGGFI